MGSVVLLACAGGGPSEPGQGTHVDCSRVAHIGLVGLESRLHRGVEMTVRLQDAGGAPLDAATYAGCLRLMCADCSALDGAGDAAPVREAIAADGAMTAVLVAPGRSAASAARARAVVEAFLAARPAGERIAVFRWGARVEQAGSFTADRAVLGRQAARALVAVDEAPVPAAQAVAVVRGDVDALARGTFRGVRGLVIIAPELADADIVGAGVVTLRHDAMAMMDAGAAASALSEALDAHVEAGLVRLAWCGEGAQDVLVKAHDSEAECAVHTPAPLPEEAHLQCSPAALAAPRAYPERIEIAFASEEQEAAYAQRIEDLSKEPFAAMLRLWEDGALAPAQIHLRGQSSLLYCDRKSFAVDIDGDAPRRLMPGSATDEFLLVAMCMDRYYINQYPADLLSRRLGFFPLGVRFVELVVGGEHLGVYLLIEKPTRELRGDNSRVRGIVRRKEDSYGNPPEVEYGFESEQQALDDYQSLVDDIVGGAPLEQVEARMDIDQYLRWVALMTLIGNGDYIDEVYFVSTETVDASLAPADFYSVVGWDPDELFAPCHDDGEYAVEDPHGMVFCAEAIIDHAFFADARIYARYVEVLASVLDEISADAYGAVLDEAVGQLDIYFRNEDIRRAMVELRQDGAGEVPSYQDVMEDIRDAAARMKRVFADQHADLRQAVSVWRKDNP